MPALKGIDQRDMDSTMAVGGSDDETKLSDAAGGRIVEKKLKLRRELSIQDQSARMPFRKLLLVYLGIGLALIVSFMDQTSVSTAAPTIGSDLGGSATISWVGTSFFVSNCAFQLVYGRMSDIFGRKITLQIAILLMVLGNLLCSFAKTPIQLYIFRAISGVGGGGINSIAMIVVSDVVPLKERGKYQGLISAACSMGNAIGPFVGGGLASAGQWRWLFRITAICGVGVAILIHFIIPLKPVTGSFRAKLKQIDYLGVTLSATATVLLLVPISGGGSTFAWSSPTVIVLLVLGALFAVAFVVSQWRFSKLPVLPLRLFSKRTPAIVMVQSFCGGGVLYYGNVFYVPIFLQYVKGCSALVAGALVLAFTLPQSGWGVIFGFYVSKTNHYKRIIVLGTALWTFGMGLQMLWKPTSSLGMVIGFLEINAIGIGSCIQNTLVAALATTENKDRAVVTGGRNFFRTLGASFGLAMSNAIYQSVVAQQLYTIPDLSSAQRQDLLDAALTNLDSLSPSTLVAVREAYAHGLRMVFAAFTAIGGICFLLSFLLQEVVFRKDTPELIAEKRRAKGLEADPEAGKMAAPEPSDESQRTQGKSPPNAKSHSAASSSETIQVEEDRPPGQWNGSATARLQDATVSAR